MARNPSSDIQRGESVKLTVDNRRVKAYTGETLATVLLAQGITIFNRTASGQPRGPYCNMGTCFECQVQISLAENTGRRWVRACMLTVREGMSIITGATLQTQSQEPLKAAGSDDHDVGN